MSAQSKLALLEALITSRRSEATSEDLRVRNKAKGTLIKLYQAKRWLQGQVELEAMRNGLFEKKVA